MGLGVQNYGLDNEIVIADGIFESGEITVAASQLITQGDLLSRDASGKFEKYAGSAGQSVIAMYIGNDNIEGGASGATKAERVLISGVVKSGAIKVGGVAATAAQKDLAKAAGIVPVKVTELQKQDNQ